MTLDASRIQSYRQEIASKDRQLALREIAKLRPPQIIQYIYSILQDGIQKLPADPELEDTRNFFLATEAVMKDMKDRLELYETKGICKLLTILDGLSHEKVSKDLKNLLANIAKVKVTSDMVSLYQEAELWLEGWYCHTYNAYPDKKRDKKTNEPLRDKHGVYLAIDMEDTIFRQIIKMPQLVVSEHYRDAAKILHEKLDAYQAQQELQQKQQAGELTHSVTDDVLPKLGVKLQITHQGNQTVISVAMDSQDKNLISRIENSIRVACRPQGSQVSMSTVSPSTLFTRVRSADEGWREIFMAAESACRLIMDEEKLDETKIEALMDGISKYALTQDQEEQLCRLGTNVSSQLDSYNNDSYVFPGTKIPLGMFWARAHAQLVLDTKRDLRMAKTPSDIIKILYDVRTTLIRENSDSLLPKVNKLLVGAYDSLHRLAPQPKLALQSIGAH